MPRKIDGITKHTLHLYEGDYQELMNLFPDEGAAEIIRRLVRKFLERIRGEGKIEVPNVEIKL